jgi:hypothetical protein
LKLHIIYTENDILLSQKHYTSWIQIQNDFADYKASLGPWGVEEVIDYLRQEHSDLEPAAEQQVVSFVSGSPANHLECLHLSFKS